MMWFPKMKMLVNVWCSKTFSGPCASQTKFLSHFRHRHACQVFATPTNPCACHAFHNVSHATCHKECKTYGVHFLFFHCTKTDVWVPIHLNLIDCSAMGWGLHAQSGCFWFLKSLALNIKTIRQWQIFFEHRYPDESGPEVCIKWSCKLQNITWLMTLTRKQYIENCVPVTGSDLTRRGETKIRENKRLHYDCVLIIVVNLQ